MTDPVAGVLAACADRLGADATRVLVRLGGHVGETARAAHRELAALEPARRRRHRAELLALARVPQPPWLRRVHPTWIESVLAALPPRARAALAGGSGGPMTPTEVWLARWVSALLPPLDTGEPRGELQRVLASEPAELVAWLTGIGADQLAFALGPDLSATRPLLARAGQRISEAPRRGQLGPQRAAIARCRGVTLDDEQATLVIVASRALAPHFAHEPLARWRLTRRLPHALGSVVDRELLAYAHVALDQAPRWAALLAP